jgi:hypothetical protein
MMPTLPLKAAPSISMELPLAQSIHLITQTLFNWPIKNKESASGNNFGK